LLREDRIVAAGLIKNIRGTVIAVTSLIGAGGAVAAVTGSVTMSVGLTPVLGGMAIVLLVLSYGFIKYKQHNREVIKGLMDGKGLSQFERFLRDKVFNLEKLTKYLGKTAQAPILRAIAWI